MKKHHHPPSSKSTGAHDSFVYGSHAVIATLQHLPKRAVALWLSDANSHEQTSLLAKRLGVQIKLVDKQTISHKCGGDTSHQGILLLCHPFPYSSLHEITGMGYERCLVLDGIEDPRNLGRAARSALALGAQFIVLSKDRSVGVTATAEKAAVGALAQLPVVRVTNLGQALQELKKEGFWAIGADMDAPLLPWTCDFNRPFALVVGGEGNGIRRLVRDACDMLVSIPMQDASESLNAADAATLLLYESLRQRQFPLAKK